ncbi:hypothetical protein GBA52_019611 [Prunus armeniaca]|nr:hypothetical protein GBA52_019611 [Prunus armeniaca]
MGSSTSVQAANMHNEISTTMVMARRFDKIAVEETNFFNAHYAASVENLGLRLLARNQECASLTA